MTITITFALASTVAKVRARPSDTHGVTVDTVTSWLTAGSGTMVIPAASTASWRWVFEEFNTAGNITKTRACAVSTTAAYVDLSDESDITVWTGPAVDPDAWDADVAVAYAALDAKKKNARVVTAVAVNTTAAAVARTEYVYLVSGTTTLTLPTAVANTAQYVIKNSGTDTVTVATTSSQTVDATTPGTLATLTAKRYVSDGANWWNV